jgi:hypothetical protein
VDCRACVLQRHSIPEVSVKSVGLFDKNRPAICVSSDELDHRTEFFSACDLRGFNVDELAHDLETVLFSIGVKQFQLSLNRISFLLLFTTGNSRIDDCWIHSIPLFSRLLVTPCLRPPRLNSFACLLASLFCRRVIGALKSSGPSGLLEKLEHLFG